MAARYPRLEMASSVEVDSASGKHLPPPRQSMLDWFNFWPKEGSDESGRVPEFVSFNHDFGGWLD